MNADLNILFVLRQAVGSMALEIVPDLFDRVEFLSILGEEFGLQALVVQEYLSDDRPLMDLALVPRQNDRPGQLSQQAPQEGPDVNGLEVVFPKRDIDRNPVAERADGKNRQRQDAVVLVVV